ncbi:unnamed protein product [Parnassius mnemosyne]|uniref:Uncharacterized protein n=1 Tax=Parnassius mnemosyne TaxID=213953 RepID=A0AAV1LIG5_9NEOP
MEDLMKFVRKCDPKKTRKRSVNKATWKREILREIRYVIHPLKSASTLGRMLLCSRYKPSSLPQFPQCGHKQKAFRCSELSCQDIRKFHKNIYKCTTKVKQDCFILKYCNISEAKSLKPNSKRRVSIKYTILSENGTKIPVCQKTFMRALIIKKNRIQGVIQYNTIQYNNFISGIKDLKIKNIGP